MINLYGKAREEFKEKYYIISESLKSDVTPDSLPEGTVLFTDRDYYGLSFFTVNCVTKQYVILNTGSPVQGEEEVCIPIKSFGRWDGFDPKIFLDFRVKKPEAMRTITRNVMMDQWRACYKTAKKEGLLWWVKEQCGHLVYDTFNEFLVANKISRDVIEVLLKEEYQKEKETK